MATKNNQQHITVLVVEDSKPLSSAIDKKLSLSNFSFLNARSAKEAFEQIKKNKNIDIIWLDHYLLGEENGLDFVMKLKKDKKTANIPVFVVSNTATPEKVGSYIELGVAKYYTKADHRLEDIINDMKEFLAGCKDKKK